MAAAQSLGGQSFVPHTHAHTYKWTRHRGVCADWETESVCVWVFVMRVCAPRIKQKIKISWLNFSLVGCDFSCLVAMLSLSLALAQGMACALTLLRRFGNGQHTERVSVCVLECICVQLLLCRCLSSASLAAFVHRRLLLSVTCCSTVCLCACMSVLGALLSLSFPISRSLLSTRFIVCRSFQRVLRDVLLSTPSVTFSHWPPPSPPSLFCCCFSCLSLFFPLLFPAFCCQLATVIETATAAFVASASASAFTPFVRL